MEMITFITNNIHNPNLKIMCIKNGYYDIILEKCKFLTDDYDVIWSQYLFHTVNGINKIIKCEICGKNKAKWNKNGYYIPCSKECSKKKKIKTYKLTCQEKYGVDNYAKTVECKEAYKLTCQEKYGVDGFSQTEEFKQKFKNTCQEKYGVDGFSQTEEFKQKFKNTTKIKHGTEIFFETEEFKQKSLKTYISKYGVDHISKTEEFKRKLQDINKKKLQDVIIDDFEILSYGEILTLKHRGCGGVSTISKELFILRKNRNHCGCIICNPMSKGYSSYELELYKFIKSVYKGEIIRNSRKIISPYELDIFIPKFNLAIEFNGDFWHANPSKFNRDDDIYYKKAWEIWNNDKNKRILCEKNNIRLLIVWEDDWLNNQSIIKDGVKDIFS